MKKVFIFSILMGILFFCGQKADAADYECDNVNDCRNICKDGRYDNNEFIRNSYYCVSGYAAGRIAIGRDCYKQEDCVSGAFCRSEIGDDVCRKKIDDNVYCAQANFIGHIDTYNCVYGCASGKYYNSVADAESGAVEFSCGTDPQKSNDDIGNSATGAQISDYMVPGATADSSGIVQCGRPGQKMCELCDLIKGIYDIVQFIMKIAIGIALLAITIGGVLYIVSAGDSGMMDMAKSAIKNALIGFVFVFAAYLIVNTTLMLLGTKSDLGINAQWGTFDCNSNAVQH